MFLRGRCRSCAKQISPRYAFVEFLGGILFLAAFLRYSYAAPVAWIWISLMIAGSFIDFDHYLLPDFVTIGGMVYGIALSFGAFLLVGFGVVPKEAVWFVPSPAMSLFGLALGAGGLWLLGFIGSKIAKREAMGMGDVLLLGAIGAIFGPVAALFSLIVSSIVGSVAGLVAIAISKSKRVRYRMIPYGPYLCIGCLAWMFAGGEVVAAYLDLIGFKG
jgi:leader peptidase (prepilin peptidase)/N-methyltransferase